MKFWTRSSCYVCGPYEPVNSRLFETAIALGRIKGHAWERERVVAKEVMGEKVMAKRADD